MSTTESSTSDNSKLKSTTPRSKASSTEAEPALEAPAAAPEPETDPSACFPSHIRKLGGFGAALESIEAARNDAKLPSLNRTDYRFILNPPGGLPFSVPVQVVYQAGTDKERDLGTYRIAR